MTLQNSGIYQSLTSTPWLSRIRRNHGLEHATLHVLAKRFSGKSTAWIMNAIGAPSAKSQRAIQSKKVSSVHLTIGPTV